jgi:hypothetical protein
MISKVPLSTVVMKCEQRVALGSCVRQIIRRIPIVLLLLLL